MSVVVAERLFSEAEYLAIERAADHKSEYINGRIHAVAGVSEPHNTISANITGELHQQFKGRPCRVYSNDLRVRVSETGLYTYPDAIALCAEPKLLDEHRDTLLNPTLVVEVLSPSTEAYDRGAKFAHYRRLESLKELLFVAQDRVQIDHYSRHDESWVLTEFNDLDDTIELRSVGAQLSVRNVYEHVELSQENALLRPPVSG
jgi:Uma2 family endonuclease